MTQDRHIVICAHCSNPIRVSVLTTGPAPSVVSCPYCGSENACELGGALQGDQVPPQNQTYFWTTETRLDATSGVDVTSPRSKPVED